MEIQIWTYNKNLINELMDEPSVSVGDSVEIADQVKLIYNGSIIPRAPVIPEIINFTVTFVAGVTAGVISAWLYDKLKIYLFSWNGTEKEIEEIIKKILEEKYGIKCGKTAKIKKVEDCNTIKIIANNNNIILLELNDEKNKVILKIDGIRTDEFIVEAVNGKLNIYSNAKVVMLLING